MAATAGGRYPGGGDGRPRLSTVVAYLAGGTDDGPREGRASRFGVALAGLAQELGAARREIVVLERENAELRSALNSQDAVLRSEGP